MGFWLNTWIYAPYTVFSALFSVIYKERVSAALCYLVLHVVLGCSLHTGLLRREKQCYMELDGLLISCSEGKALHGEFPWELWQALGIVESLESCQTIKKRQDKGESPELSDKVDHWGWQRKVPTSQRKPDVRGTTPKSYRARYSLHGGGSRRLRAGPSKVLTSNLQLHFRRAIITLLMIIVLILNTCCTKNDFCAICIFSNFVLVFTFPVTEMYLWEESLPVAMF